jgi:hypothetical protein
MRGSLNNRARNCFFLIQNPLKNLEYSIISTVIYWVVKEMCFTVNYIQTSRDIILVIIFMQQALDKVYCIWYQVVHLHLIA